MNNHNISQAPRYGMPHALKGKPGFCLFLFSLTLLFLFINILPGFKAYAGDDCQTPVLSSGLELHIPELLYRTADGNTHLWARMIYTATDQGPMFRVTETGSSTPADAAGNCTATLSETLELNIPLLLYQTSEGASRLRVTLEHRLLNEQSYFAVKSHEVIGETGCTGDRPDLCETGADCENAGGFWKNEACEKCAPDEFLYDFFCLSDQMLEPFGFGTEDLSHAHVDKNFQWYIDQAHTGVHSNDNCGPSTTVMAINWHMDNAFTGTAEDARNAYRPEGGWWYTSDIISYLNDNAVINRTVRYTDEAQLAAYIKEGSLVILCIDTTYLPKNNNPDERIGRFYSYSDGHFLIVKGVRNVDGKLLFETYDSNTWDRKYPDDSPKGKNRHYKAENLTAAISNWWKYLIVVSPPGTPAPPKARYRKDAVDVPGIEHKWGR